MALPEAFIGVSRSNSTAEEPVALVAEIAAGTHRTLDDLDANGVVVDAELTVWLAEAGAVNLASVIRICWEMQP